jgi:uncharacterized phage infection (PIP) family protein YhgE
MLELPSPDKVQWAQSFTGVRIASGPGQVLFAAPGGAPGGGPAPAQTPAAKKNSATQKSEEQDLTDQVIDEIIGDPVKRLQELAKRKIPVFSEAYKTDSPRSKFLEDLQSGIESAKQNIEYIAKAADYVKKTGKGFEAIGKGAAQLKKISDKLSAGLGAAGDVVGKAKQLSQWLDAVDDFANVSSKMDPTDIGSVDHWVSSMKNLYDKTSPFLHWVEDKGVMAAIADSSAAGAALSTVLSSAVSLVYVGIGTLHAGIKNEEAYFDKYARAMYQINQESNQPPPAEPMPTAPGPWESMDEKIANAHNREDAELRRSMKYERDSKAQAEAEAKRKIIDATTTKFEDQQFAAIYIAHRPHIYKMVLDGFRKADGGPAREWIDCFVSDDAALKKLRDNSSTSGDPADDPGWWDAKAGAYVTPIKARVSTEEAKGEISKLMRASFPYLKQLHDTELKKQIDRALAQQ